VFLFTLIVVSTLFVAYANGANDNFKGVATLFGSGVTDYRKALAWATVMTFAGSVCSIFLAASLIKNFSGKGLVPDAIVAAPGFLLAVSLAAGGTVILATFLSFPVSTTHSLTGALVGAGFVASGSQVNLSQLAGSFVLPLMLSPLIAVILGGVAYLLTHSARVYSGVTKEWCICVGETTTVVPACEPPSVFASAAITLPNIAIATKENCHQRYSGGMVGVSFQKLIDFGHFLSAGTVSFARGLNDTPKIVALLLVVKALDVKWGMLGVALGMALGGLCSARRVALTMSKKITPLTPGQGFTANVVTAALVIFASRLGMPVSTTHVSCGSLFGIGLITRQAHVSVISQIVLSWILTLPVSALLGAGLFWVLA